MSRTGMVIVASTRAATGEYEDRSGPIAVEFLLSQGFDTPEPLVVADADIQSAVDKALSGSDVPDVLLTSGGTGITPDDRTVEAVKGHLRAEMPGIAVAFWNKGLENVPTAALSRCIAGVTDKTFVMTLPGSTGGVKDGCAVLEEILGHIITTMEGNNDH
ncbi:MogA/MoaB family molybdenum cofactor biosynthesis protein [Corynebacterium ammoniagenes]|uniref:MogA/MoaB family molybdenum cofactor biosynthesis protein n=1 Tax=Corynebacterium ammoniagenes TaxID=1697 RepID=UPI0014591C7D|nr:MogA/MoaB family molybdenum cofactor biosynthesis protein [Corynebacterium ammoniagenes]NMF32407.1 MogA/MoaB family molybdenum cofactor biosynthesis protein [Corynebacterium ammoniagenes]